MISLSVTTGGVRFTFENSAYYLYGNGTIDVPLNSLLLVNDESDSVTFKKIDGDVFISAPVSEFDMSKSDIEEFYENNMVGAGGVDPEEVVDIVASGTSYYDGVEYDSVNSRINFKHGNTIEAYVDASPFIVDGMVDNVAIVNGNLVITFNTDSGKQPISIPLTDIFNPNNYYDKNAVDNIISGVNDSIIEDEEVISSALNDLNERKLDASAYTPTDLTNYYTKSETSGATEIQGALDNKANKTAAVGGYQFGSTNNVNKIQLKSVSSANIGSEIYYPTINGKGIFTNSNTYAINNYDFQLVETSAITTSVTSASTDTEIPSAKAVYDALGQGGGGGSTYVAGRGIDITTEATADTISFNLPISADSTVYTLLAGSVNVNANDNYLDNVIAIGKNNTLAGYLANRKLTNPIVIGSGNTIKRGLNFGSKICTIGFDNEINGGETCIIGFNNKLGNVKNYPNSIIIGNSNSASSNNDYSGLYLFGRNLNATKSNEFAIGKYNTSSNDGTSSGNTFFSIGDGTSTAATHNAFEIRQNGDIYITKNGADVKLQDHLGGSASSAITSGDTNAVQGGAVYDKFDEVEQVTAAALNNLNNKFGGLSLVKLTQAEYNALTTKDNNTLYVIVD